MTSNFIKIQKIIRFIPMINMIVTVFCWTIISRRFEVSFWYGFKRDLKIMAALFGVWVLFLPIYFIPFEWLVVLLGWIEIYVCTLIISFGFVKAQEEVIIYEE